MGSISVRMLTMALAMCLTRVPNEALRRTTMIFRTLCIPTMLSPSVHMVIILAMTLNPVRNVKPPAVLMTAGLSRSSVPQHKRSRSAQAPSPKAMRLIRHHLPTLLLRATVTIAPPVPPVAVQATESHLEQALGVLSLASLLLATREARVCEPSRTSMHMTDIAAGNRYRERFEDELGR